MIFGLFKRRRSNEAVIDRLYGAVTSAARQPAFYRDLGVPDTVEGRFEMVTLHAVLTLRRLKALPDPGGELAQDLVDTTFQHFDAALRELGVSDIGVPKKMKTLAEAFYGRAAAYEAALGEGEAALARALGRNILGQEDAASAKALVTYTRDSVAALDAAGLDAFTAGVLPFPEIAADSGTPSG